ncbi:hypothetical protein BsWGS_10360 [Bradybaena similaris]
MSTFSIVLKLAFYAFVAQGFIDGCEAECIRGQLDVIFLFDSSSTVGSGDFNRSLQFASNLAENFKIGPDSLQFGAASFSDSPINLFNLNTYTEFQQLEKAILNSQYLSGSTRTYLALENAQTLFDQSRGGRTGAPKVVVLFTNGRSDDADRTQQQALRLKNSGVFVIVVGLSNSNSQELQAVASNSSAVFNIDNFSSVLKFLQDYSNSACSIQPAECIKGHLDVIFLFDSSSTVGSGDFNRSLQFSSNLAENFQLGPEKVQFGAASFSDNPNNLFNLNTYSEFHDLEKAILNSQYLSGSTRTYLVLENAQTLFDQSRGGRTGAPKVVVLFTNGRSDDADRTQQQALRLKNSGVFVIVVGLSNSNTQELQAVASNSSAVFSIDNFSSVLKFLQDYSNSACSIQPVPCMNGTLDVLYVFDASYSVPVDDFNNGLRFAANLAENFHIGMDGVLFGTISFATSTRRIFDFATFTNYTGLEKAILDIAYDNGSANTFLALEDSRNFFGDSQGARLGAPRVAIVFTNGKSSDVVKTAAQATALKQAGVFVISVGYPSANRQELQSIASDPSYVFSIDNFNSVLNALQNYGISACNRSG